MVMVSLLKVQAKSAGCLQAEGGALSILLICCSRCCSTCCNPASLWSLELEGSKLKCNHMRLLEVQLADFWASSKLSITYLGPTQLRCVKCLNLMAVHGGLTKSRVDKQDERNSLAVLGMVLLSLLPNGQIPRPFGISSKEGAPLHVMTSLMTGRQSSWLTRPFPLPLLVLFLAHLQCRWHMAESKPTARLSSLFRVAAVAPDHGAAPQPKH